MGAAISGSARLAAALPPVGTTNTHLFALSYDGSIFHAIKDDGMTWQEWRLFGWDDTAGRVPEGYDKRFSQIAACSGGWGGGCNALMGLEVGTARLWVSFKLSKSSNSFTAWQPVPVLPASKEASRFWLTPIGNNNSLIKGVNILALAGAELLAMDVMLPEQLFGDNWVPASASVPADMRQLACALREVGCHAPNHVGNTIIWLHPDKRTIWYLVHHVTRGHKEDWWNSNAVALPPAPVTLHEIATMRLSGKTVHVVALSSAGDVWHISLQQDGAAGEWRQVAGVSSARHIAGSYQNVLVSTEDDVYVAAVQDIARGLWNPWRHCPLACEVASDLLYASGNDKTPPRAFFHGTDGAVHEVIMREQDPQHCTLGAPFAHLVQHLALFDGFFIQPNGEFAQQAACHVTVTALGTHGVPMMDTLEAAVSASLTIFVDRAQLRSLDNLPHAMELGGHLVKLELKPGQQYKFELTGSKLTFIVPVKDDDMLLPTIYIRSPDRMHGTWLVVEPDRAMHNRLMSVTGAQLLGQEPMKGNSEPQRLLRQNVNMETAEAVATALSSVLSMSIDHRRHSNPPLQASEPGMLDVVSFMPRDPFVNDNGVVPMHHSFGGAEGSEKQVANPDAMASQHWQFGCRLPAELDAASLTDQQTLAALSTASYSYESLTEESVKAALASKTIDAQGDALTAAVLHAFQGGAFDTHMEYCGYLETKRAEFQAQSSQDAEAAVLGLWGNIWAYAKRVWTTVVKVVESGVKAVLTVFEVIKDGVTKFVAKVVHLVEDAVAFVKGLLQKFQDLVKSVVDFIKTLFAWDDIAHLVEGVRLGIRHLLGYIKANMADGRKLVLTWYDDIVGSIKDGIQQGMLQDIQGNHQASSLLDGRGQVFVAGPVQEEYFFGLFAACMQPEHASGLEDMAQPDRLQQVMQQFQTGLGSQAKVLITKMHEHMDSIRTTLAGIRSPGDINTKHLATMCADVFDLLADLFRPILSSSLQLIEDLVVAVEAISDESMELPLLSSLFKLMTGKDLRITIMDVMLYASCIPITVAYKASKGGKAPMSQQDVDRLRSMDACNWRALMHLPSITVLAGMDLTVPDLDPWQDMFVMLSAFYGCVSAMLQGATVLPKYGLLSSKQLACFSVMSQCCAFPIMSLGNYTAHSEEAYDHMEMANWSFQWLPALASVVRVHLSQPAPRVMAATGDATVNEGDLVVDSTLGVVTGALGIMHLAIFIAMGACNPAKEASNIFQATANCLAGCGEAMELPAALLPEYKLVFEVLGKTCTVISAGCMFSCVWWQLAEAARAMNPR